MQIRQLVCPAAGFAAASLDALQAIDPHLILCFGDVSAFGAGLYTRLRDAFPHAHLAGCSTAGEIAQNRVFDASVVLTAVRFVGAAPQYVTAELAGMADSEAAGERLAGQIGHAGLGAVLVLAQGVEINGSALIRGMRAHLPESVPLMGGLAADGGAFRKTQVLTDSGVSDTALVALGFDTTELVAVHGCYGGWQPFGPLRRVTRCEGNVLFELDGESALAIYRRYLGEYASELPASGLLFPFLMLDAQRSDLGLIRTILGVDEARGALILAGEIAADGYMQMMHASADALVEGAGAAAEMAHKICAGTDGLVLLVSCVGRKLVMGDRVEEEVEAVADVFGPTNVVCGFYSNGEISPFLDTTECKLHNQTMTVTCLFPRR